jgi:hypothetical protein
VGRRRRIAVAAAGAVWLAGGAVGAEQTPLSVRLTIHDCDRPLLSTIDVYSALTLELNGDGVERVVLSASPGLVDADLDVSLHCGASLTATMVLVTPSSGRETVRSFRIDDIRRADRPRALSLMAAEFVRREWPSLIEAERVRRSAVTQNSEPVEKPTKGAREATASPVGHVTVSPSPTGIERKSAPASERALAPAPERAVEPRVARGATSLELAASGEVRWFASYDSWLWGGNVGLCSGRFCARAEGLAAVRNNHLGTASVAIVSAGGGVRLWQGEASRFQWALGLAAALGTTWATGHSDRAAVSVIDKTTFYADGRLVAEGAIRLGSTRILGSIEGGRAAGMVSFAGDEIAGATGGWFFGASVGLGLVP